MERQYVLFIVFVWLFHCVERNQGTDDDAMESNHHHSVGIEQQQVEQIHKVEQLCGPLCSFPDDWPPVLAEHISIQHFTANAIKRQVQCSNLFSKRAERLLDLPAVQWPPPRVVPPSLLDKYTMNNRAEVFEWYLPRRYAGSNAKIAHWTQKSLENLKQDAMKGKLRGTYGFPVSKSLRQVLIKSQLQGKHVLVVGSELPWVEAILLSVDVANITTLEYGAIHSSHPQVFTMVPAKFNTAWNMGKLPLFDAALSISSLEHSGLGRYGDQINPWSDVITVAKISCVVKRGGLIFVSVPTCHKDVLVWDAHRIYGPLRWPLLMTNWKVIDITENTGVTKSCEDLFTTDHHLRSPMDTIPERIVVAINERD